MKLPTIVVFVRPGWGGRTMILPIIVVFGAPEAPETIRIGIMVVLRRPGAPELRYKGFYYRSSGRPQHENREIRCLADSSTGDSERGNRPKY